jgi:hypothetical protein
MLTCTSPQLCYRCHVRYHVPFQALTALCGHPPAAFAVCSQADVIGNNTLGHKVVNRVIINHDSLVTSKQLVSIVLAQMNLNALKCALACLVLMCCTALTRSPLAST